MNIKHIELLLKKRILVVETNDLGFSEEKVIIGLGDSERYIANLLGENREIQFICKGSELNEEIVKKLIPYNEETGLYNGFNFPMFAFVDAINELGFYWNEKNRPEIKNFNPEKTWIIEIF